MLRDLVLQAAQRAWHAGGRAQAEEQALRARIAFDQPQPSVTATVSRPRTGRHVLHNPATPRNWHASRKARGV
jgi:hypothetical protein